ncbi:MAG: hypothetical protein WD266_07695 [Balneolales bacterium]
MESLVEQYMMHGMILVVLMLSALILFSIGYSMMNMGLFQPGSIQRKFRNLRDSFMSKSRKVWQRIIRNKKVLKP